MLFFGFRYLPLLFLLFATLKFSDQYKCQKVVWMVFIWYSITQYIQNFKNFPLSKFYWIIWKNWILKNIYLSTVETFFLSVIIIFYLSLTQGSYLLGLVSSNIQGLRNYNCSWTNIGVPEKRSHIQIKIVAPLFDLFWTKKHVFFISQNSGSLDRFLAEIFFFT